MQRTQLGAGIGISVLFLLFQLGKDRYALDVRQVVEVMPPIAAKQFPQAPAAVLGAINYRGTSVPLIDLSQLALGRPAQPRLSTRIILVHYPDGSGKPRLLGLLAEHVTETMNRAASEFTESGVSLADARYLGRVTTDAKGLVQWIEVDKLLATDVRDLLFRSPMEA